MAATIEELKKIEEEMLKQLIEVSKNTREQAAATPSKAAFRKEMSQVGGGSSSMPGPGSIAKQHFGSLARMGGQKAAGWLSGHAPGSMGGGQGGMFAKLAAGAGGDGAAAAGGIGKVMGGGGAGGMAGGATKALGGIGAVVAVGQAIAAVPGKIKDFADRLHEANKALAQFSPSMGRAVMYGEQRDAIRKYQQGEQLSSSALRMEEGRAKLGDALAPFETFVADMKNELAGALAEATGNAMQSLGLTEAMKDLHATTKRILGRHDEIAKKGDDVAQLGMIDQMFQQTVNRIHDGQIRRVNLRDRPPLGEQGKRR